MTALTPPHPRARRSRRAPAARALAVSLGAACAASTPAAPVPSPAVTPLASTQPASIAAEPLELTVQVRATRGGVTLRVERGDTLKTGDVLELFVHLNQPAYLYVLELSPGGEPWMLFPQHGDRLLTAGTPHRIPEVMSQSLQVDPHDRTEDIYVVMSRAPVGSIGPLISALAPPSERRVAPRPQPKPLRTDVRFDITTRRVIVVDRPDQAPSVIDARDPHQDSTLVVQLSFKHA